MYQELHPGNAIDILGIVNTARAKSIFARSINHILNHTVSDFIEMHKTHLKSRDAALTFLYR